MKRSCDNLGTALLRRYMNCHRWMDGCMDGWMDGWLDGWMDGFCKRADECQDILKNTEGLMTSGRTWRDLNEFYAIFDIRRFIRVWFEQTWRTLMVE